MVQLVCQRSSGGQLVLIAVVALTAVYARKKVQREAALTVLQLLLPRRRHDK